MSNVTVITEASDAAIVVTTDQTYALSPASAAVQILKTLSDANGIVQSINTIGFKPRSILFSAGTTSGGMSTGFACLAANGGVIQACQEMLQGGQVYSQPTIPAILRDVTPNGPANYQYIQMISFDPSGFTVQWTKGGSPTTTGWVNALCFR